MNNSISDRQKHEAAKRRQFAFRLNIFFFSVFVLFSVLIVRLAILQFVEVNEMQTYRFANDVRSMDIPPIRGNIYDLHGYPIAYSTSTQSLYFRIEAGHQKEDVIALAYRLSDVFEQYGDEGKAKLTAEEIVRLMNVAFDVHGNERVITNFNYIPRRIKVDLSKAEIAYILEHRDEFRGIEIIEESVRNYDENRIAVQLIGYLRQFSAAKDHYDYYKTSGVLAAYTDIENVGFEGLELMYQEQMRGTNGSKSYPVNKLGQIVGSVEVQPPVKGHNIYLTMDKDMQLKAEEAVAEHIAFLQSDEAAGNRFYAAGRKAATGYVVAMEVKTGKVMAMVSYPDYDPSVWAGGRISQKDYEENETFMKNGTISEAYPNYADYAERAKHPTSLVPLGSTIKPLTVLLGFKEGLLTPNDVYQDTGVFSFGLNNAAKLRNSDSRVLGRIRAEEAIRLSSNTFMSAMIGNPLYRKYGVEGIEVWDDYMESFGLGVTTGSGLPNEIRGTKEYMNLQAAGSAQAALIYASWGQQGRYTALQLAQFAATLASKGKRLQPQFVERITTHDGITIEELEPVILNEIEFTEEQWNVVDRGMNGVPQQGFSDFQHSFRAKTGTSQQQVAGGEIVMSATHIAYAPAEDPVLAVAVIVPNGGHGGYGAAPISRKIFDAYDESFGLIQD